MATNPYRDKPSSSFWRKAVAGTPPFALDPFIGEPKFKIAAGDKVATAGSCFAQHISRALVRNGFDYFVTETAPIGVTTKEADARNYGVFSARYGNVYTARQLRQLLERASGRRVPALDHWSREDGRLVDPFRPQIEPNGFDTAAAVLAERKKHLDAVRRLASELDVLVFTLGLTESWVDKADGSVLPLAPGVAGGEWDEGRYAFVNLTTAEIVEDMCASVDLIREVNPKARVLLTVSPVPLIATYRNQHVLVSNTYSKSSLRVAAEEISESRENVQYFPSYEIITALSAGNKYYEDDLRSIKNMGVDHVMRVFFKHLLEGGESSVDSAVEINVRGEIQQAHAVVCDEEAIDR